MTKYRRWTEEDCSIAATLYAAEIERGPQGPSVKFVAERLGRSFASVMQRLHERGPTFNGPQRYLHRHVGRERSKTAYICTVHSEPPPAHVISEWNRRSTLQPASLTAFLMGDPLPGTSALDRRGA
jgi:hypothetical protein